MYLVHPKRTVTRFCSEKRERGCDLLSRSKQSTQTEIHEERGEERDKVQGNQTRCCVTYEIHTTLLLFVINIALNHVMEGTSSQVTKKGDKKREREREENWEEDRE